jgi:hypothetical protein
MSADKGEKMNFAIKSLAVLGLALPLVALAQSTAPTTPGADQRQINQAARIQQGADSGSLTTREAARLEQGQTHVQNVENKVKADGTVTAKERARLHHAQDQQSRKIYRQKHDRQHDFNHDGKNDRRQRRAG